MPNYVQNYVAIFGDEEKVYDLKMLCFVPVETHISALEDLYWFDLDRLIPVPAELAETSAPTKVFDTQEELDRSNREFLHFPLRGSAKYNAITREEAERRTHLYGRLPTLPGVAGTEFGILNWYDWSIVNRGVKWGRMQAEQLHREHGLVVFRIESAWTPPIPIYHLLVDMGFKVAWTWQGEEPDQWGRLDDYAGIWKRETVYNFDRQRAQRTWDDLEFPSVTLPMDMLIRKQQLDKPREDAKRRSWAKWFRESPENRARWDEWFPNHNFDEWISQFEDDED